MVKLWSPTFTHLVEFSKILITHSQREAYMDLVENGGACGSGSGGRKEIEVPQGML